MRDLRKGVDRALRMGGGLYDFEDILGGIEDGRMQSFVDGENWVVTQISNYPRKIVLELVLAAGTIEGLDAMVPELEAFARLHSCELIMATGRVGWEGVMRPGWKKTYSTFVREL